MVFSSQVVCFASFHRLNKKNYRMHLLFLTVYSMINILYGYILLFP